MPKHDFKNKRFVRGLRRLAFTLAKVQDMAELLRSHAVLVHSSIGRPASAHARRPSSPDVKRELLEVVLRWQAANAIATHASDASDVALGAPAEKKLRLVFGKDGDVRVHVDQGDTCSTPSAACIRGISGLDVKHTSADSIITRKKGSGIFGNFEDALHSKENHKIKRNLSKSSTTSNMPKKYGGVCKLPTRQFVETNTWYLKEPQSIQSNPSLVDWDNLLPPPQALISHTEWAAGREKMSSEILLKAADLISQQHSNNSLLSGETQGGGARSAVNIVNATPANDKKAPRRNSFTKIWSQVTDWAAANKPHENKQIFQPLLRKSQVGIDSNSRNNIQIAQQPPSLQRLNAYLAEKTRVSIPDKTPQVFQQPSWHNKLLGSKSQVLSPQIDTQHSDERATNLPQTQDFNKWCRQPEASESNLAQNRCPLASDVKATDESERSSSQVRISPHPDSPGTWDIQLPDIEFPSLQSLSHARFLSNIPENEKWNVQKPTIPQNNGNIPELEDDMLFTELPEKIDTWLIGWPDESYYKERQEGLRSKAYTGSGRRRHRAPKGSDIRRSANRRQLTKLQSASKKRLTKQLQPSSKDKQRESKSESLRSKKDRASAKHRIKKRNQDATVSVLRSKKICKKHSANTSDTSTELIQNSSSGHKKIPKAKESSSSKSPNPDEQRKRKVSPVASHQSHKSKSTHSRKVTASAEDLDAEKDSDQEVHKKSAKHRKEKPVLTEPEPAKKAAKKSKSSASRQLTATSTEYSPPESVSSRKATKSSSKEKSKKRCPPAEPRNVPKTSPSEKPSTRNKEKGDSKQEAKASVGEKPPARAVPGLPVVESRSRHKPKAPSDAKEARSLQVPPPKAKKPLSLSTHSKSPRPVTPPNSGRSTSPTPPASKVTVLDSSAESHCIKFSPHTFQPFVKPAATADEYLHKQAGTVQSGSNSREFSRHSSSSDASFSVLESMSPNRSSQISSFKESSPSQDSYSSSFRRAGMTGEPVQAAYPVAERMHSAPLHRPVGFLTDSLMERKPFLRRVQDVIKSRFFNCSKLKCRGSKCFCARQSDTSIEEMKGING